MTESQCTQREMEVAELLGFLLRQWRWFIASLLIFCSVVTYAYFTAKPIYVATGTLAPGVIGFSETETPIQSWSLNKLERWINFGDYKNLFDAKELRTILSARAEIRGRSDVLHLRAEFTREDAARHFIQDLHDRARKDLAERISKNDANLMALRTRLVNMKTELRDIMADTSIPPTAPYLSKVNQEKLDDLLKVKENMLLEKKTVSYTHLRAHET